jgi:hypothetical protein
MKFNTQYDARERIHTCSGSPLKQLFTGRYNERGQIELTEDGTENIYEYIQSFAESTDIHSILRRYQNGEVDVLSKVQGVYTDITEMPQTYAEALQPYHRPNTYRKSQTDTSSKNSRVNVDLLGLCRSAAKNLVVLLLGHFPTTHKDLLKDLIRFSKAVSSTARISGGERFVLFIFASMEASAESRRRALSVSKAPGLSISKRRSK